MTIEMTFTSENEARAAWRDYINKGRTVSLLAFDACRNLYVFDLYA